MEFVYILPDKDAGVASVVRNLLRFNQTGTYTKVLLLHNKNAEEKRRIKDDFNCNEMVRITYNGKWSSKYHILKKIYSNLTNKSIIISNDGGIELEVTKVFNLLNPVIYIMHGNYNHYYKVLKESHHSVDRIICVSAFLQHKVETLLKDCSYLIPVRNIKFPVPEVISTSNNADKIRIVYAGSLIAAKGVNLFKEIADILDAKNVDYRFNIIGDGAEKTLLEKNFITNKRVKLLGHLANENVLQMHENHDVLLLCSKKEGLPVSIVEGMKAGVVPVVSDIESGIPELVINDITGYKIKIDDAAAFADKIELLYNNKILLKKIKHNCIKFATEKFNPMQQALLYENEFLNTKKQQKVEMSKMRVQTILMFLPNIIVFKSIKVYKNLIS